MKGIAAPPGLFLEPLTAAHAAAMHRVLSDPAIYRYLDHGPPASVAALAGTYARWERRVSPDGRERWLNWVLRGADGEPIGHLQATVGAHGAAAIAYVLASRHWGRGYARSATAAMLAHLAAEYACTRFRAVVEAGNLRSIALLEALSFRRSGLDEAAQRDLAPTELLYTRSAT